jgi:hypothetical protein
MKILFIAMAVGAAALVGESAANATDNAVRTKDGTGVTQSSTDFSSHRRHWHRYGYYRPHYRSYGYYRPYYRSYGYYRPYYRSYGYYGRPYYGGYYGGPSVTFSFGGGRYW